MLEHGGYCGIDCAKCPAYIATKKNDTAAYAKIATEWSKAFGVDIPAEAIPCDGCYGSDKGKPGCHTGDCDIRACAVTKNGKTCADCGDYVCEKLDAFFKMAPDAKASLDALRE